MSEYVKAGEPLRAQWANDVVRDLRRLKGGKGVKLNFLGGGDDAGCPFGTFALSGTKYYIQGGVVYCGDKNINVTNNDLIITSTTPRTKLVYFEIPLTVNMDDDSKILLPGVDTTSWTAALEEVDVGTGYPANTQPTLPSGNGTMIVPLGTLTVPSSGSWTFLPVSCGNITIDHCAGVLYLTRGTA